MRIPGSRLREALRDLLLTPDEISGVLGFTRQEFNTFTIGVVSIPQDSCIALQRLMMSARVFVGAKDFERMFVEAVIDEARRERPGEWEKLSRLERQEIITSAVGADLAAAAARRGQRVDIYIRNLEAAAALHAERKARGEHPDGDPGGAR